MRLHTFQLFLYRKRIYFNFNFTLGKSIQKIHSANIGFGYEALKSSYESFTDTLQSVISIMPYYQLHHERANLVLGVNLSVFDKEIWFFPNVSAEYKLIGEYLIPYVGFDGKWQPNDMQQLTLTNPYLKDLETSYSRILQGFLGIKGKLW
jgi:hypothetical protein